MGLVPVRSCVSTYVQSNLPQLTPCRSDKLPVGLWFEIETGCRCEYMSYLFFHLPPLSDHYDISSAHLVLNPTSTPFLGSPPRKLNLQALRGSFRDCCTNYRSRPEGIFSTNIEIPMPLHPNPIMVDVTNIVKMWYSGALPNRGLALLPDLESTHNGIWVFASPYHPHWSLHPMLHIYTDERCHACSFVETCNVTLTEQFSSTREVWCFSVWSFVVQNIGDKKVRVRLQDSPDGSAFFDEVPELELAPGKMEVLVNQYFTRFSRVKYRLAEGETGEGRIKLWFQGRQG
ncbi:MAG: DNRLRE domain-containing protein [Syntrophothermus sp.]|uniref:DUF6385 domain-containing protein n=1 Tax=Syntrophothermus sp. TaxID=2736299 RepID=UPI00257BAC5A|nr:DUF6385 domain-containing protein [Syntrophothermus sp.]NSW83485.1 DNRLRE domain-containing protein [Syntrophothermus sp.]